MKEVKAFIHPSKVYDVVEQLKEDGFKNVTLSNAEGTGDFSSRETTFTSLDFSVSDSVVTKIELVCSDEQVDRVIDIIHQQGKTGQSGDGLIYVSPVDQAYKVKSGREIIDESKGDDG